MTIAIVLIIFAFVLLRAMVLGYEDGQAYREEQKMNKPICNECGREIEFGNRDDGLPNGVGFVLEDGTKVDVCTECIMKIGEEYESLHKGQQG